MSQNHFWGFFWTLDINNKKRLSMTFAWFRKCLLSDSHLLLRSGGNVKPACIIAIDGKPCPNGLPWGWSGIGTDATWGRRRGLVLACTFWIGLTWPTGRLFISCRNCSLHEENNARSSRIYHPKCPEFLHLCTAVTLIPCQHFCIRSARGAIKITGSIGSSFKKSWANS